MLVAKQTAIFYMMGDIDVIGNKHSIDVTQYILLSMNLFVLVMQCHSRVVIGNGSSKIAKCVVQGGGCIDMGEY